MMGEEEKEELKAKLQCLSSLVSSLKKKRDNGQKERYKEKPNRSSAIIPTTASSSSKVWVRNTIEHTQQPKKVAKIPNVTATHIHSRQNKSFNMKKEITAFGANVWRKTDGSPKSSFSKPNQVQKYGTDYCSKSRFRLNRLPSPKKPETSSRKSLSDLMSLNKDEANDSETPAHDSPKLSRISRSSAKQIPVSLFSSDQVWSDQKLFSSNDCLKKNKSVIEDSHTKIAKKNKSSTLISLNATTTNSVGSLSSSKHVWNNPNPASSSNVVKSRNIVASPVKSSEIRNTGRRKKINLSKHVWTKKDDGKLVSSEKHKWMKSSLKPHGSRTTKGRTLSSSIEELNKNRLYCWTSNESKRSSFLSRRSRIVIKHSRFALVRSYGSSPQKIVSQLDNKSSTTSYKYWRKPVGYPFLPFSKQRNFSFIRRRMQFVASKSPELFKKTNVWNSPKQYKAINTKYTKTNVASPGRKTSGGREVSKVLFNVRGTKFQTDVKGRKLQRVVSSEYKKGKHASSIIKEMPRNTEKKILNRYKLVTRKKNSVSEKAVTKVLASRVLRKSVAHLYHTKSKKATKKDFCMFYNRFGKCKNGKSCRYIHDPDKVAICTRFLRGTCKNADGACLFSHKIDSQKMPTCSFFLRGMCHKDDCPYAHVKVSQTADVCEDFLKGHCPEGNKCLKKHIRECEEFPKTGKCSSGKSCKLIHRINPRKRKRSSSSSGTKIPKPFRRSAKQNRIEQEGESVSNDGTASSEILQIKPQFLMAEHSERFRGSFVRLKRKREMEKDNLTTNIIQAVHDTHETDEKDTLTANITEPVSDAQETGEKDFLI